MIEVGKSAIYMILIMFLLPLTAIIARCEMANVTISAPVDVFILVDGVTQYGHAFIASVGSRVCILSEVVYESMEVRYRFAFWVRDKAVISNNTCITVDKGGDYRAIYTREYLITILSEPLLFTESFWVGQSGRFNYTAPMEIRANDIYYKFEAWRGDIININNTISLIATRPSRLIAVYTPCYPLYIKDELIGYFPSGHTYHYRVEAKEEDDVKHVVENLVVIGGTAIRTDSDVFAIMIREKTVVIPVYRTFYKVLVETPQGTLSYWVEKDTSYTLSVPQTIGGDCVVYTFVMWEGDVISSSSTYTLQVKKPMHVRAIYTKTYKVVVISPTGEKVRYVVEGDVLYIYEPPQLGGIVTARVLRGFLVNGLMHQPIAPGVLKLDSITEPLTIIAIYEEQLLWTNIAIIASFLAAIIAAYAIFSTKEKAKRSTTEEPGGG